MDPYQTAVDSCIDCGKCGETCPICMVSDNPIYTPDNKIKLVAKIASGEELEKDEFDSVYLCMQCGACNDVCPVDIPISKIIRHERELIAKQGKEPEKTKRIVNNVLEKKNTSGIDNSKRSEWVTDDLRFSKKSDIGYMAGCWVAFKHPEIAQSTIRVLNSCGIEPMLLEEERCCGLFVIDNGHLDEAREYAIDYVNYIESLGIKKLLLSCPACYGVLKFYYAELYREPKFEVVATIELFKQLINEGKLKLKQAGGTVSVKDGCPLRHMYDVPREILASMGMEIAEICNKETLCCGAPAGVKPNYPDIADDIGMLSLQKAKEISELMVTYCPFCQYHLEGVSEKRGVDEPMKDIASLLDENLE
ncbi:MAG: (Fe-S)-binding protein [Methermicoccaceae archaeon]